MTARKVSSASACATVATGALHTHCIFAASTPCSSGLLPGLSCADRSPPASRTPAPICLPIVVFVRRRPARLPGGGSGTDYLGRSAPAHVSQPRTYPASVDTPVTCQIAHALLDFAHTIAIRVITMATVTSAHPFLPDSTELPFLDWPPSARLLDTGPRVTICREALSHPQRTPLGLGFVAPE